MKDKILSLFGLCRKSGRLIQGFDPCAQSLRDGKAKAIFTSEDLSPKSKKEIAFIAAKTGIEVISVPVTMKEIEDKTGKRAGILAVTDEGFVKAISIAISRAD